MDYANELYLGKTARSVKAQLVEELARDQYRKDLFFILLSENPHDLLEILQADKFEDKVFCKYTDLKRVKVVGIAVTFDEALDLMKFMVLDIHKKTGDFDVKAYFSFDAETA